MRTLKGLGWTLLAYANHFARRHERAVDCTAKAASLLLPPGTSGELGHGDHVRAWRSH